MKMTTEKIIVTNYERALTNPDYILEALENSNYFNAIQDGSLVEIKVRDVSMRHSSWYGTWQVYVTLDINGTERVYYLTHHNEDWYISQKIAYDSNLADTEEEYEKAVADFQYAFEAAIDRNIDEIVSVIEAECESKTSN